MTPDAPYRRFRFLGVEWRVAPASRSDGLTLVLYWLVASPLILASFTREVGGWRMLASYAAIVVLLTTATVAIVNVLLPTFLARRRYAASAVAYLAILVAVAGLSYGADALLYGWEGRSWEAFARLKLPNEAQNLLTVVAIVAGKKFNDERVRRADLEAERGRAELSRLRAQVDPHFLFNALNILDVLIEDDAPEARRFVHRLSSLYRYLIRHRDEDLVPAADELRYARDYHYLVEQRFGASFAFRQNLPDADLRDRYMPPGSLQAVLENVYKHNLATERNPITITLEARGDALYVANDFSPKPGDLAPRERSGSGTANLTRRYSLLTDEEVYARREGGQWVVRLPLLTASPSSRTRAQPSGTAASRPPR